MMRERKLHHGKQWSFDNDNPGDELGDRGDPPLTAVKPHYRVGEAKGIWHFQELQKLNRQMQCNCSCICSASIHQVSSSLLQWRVQSSMNRYSILQKTGLDSSSCFSPPLETLGALEQLPQIKRPFRFLSRLIEPEKRGNAVAWEGGEPQAKPPEAKATQWKRFHDLLLRTHDEQAKGCIYELTWQNNNRVFLSDDLCMYLLLMMQQSCTCKLNRKITCQSHAPEYRNSSSPS